MTPNLCESAELPRTTRPRCEKLCRVKPEGTGLRPVERKLAPWASENRNPVDPPECQARRSRKGLEGVHRDDKGSRRAGKRQ